MKGILFPGDSFTWGQSLHFYSDLDDVLFEKAQFEMDDILSAHKRYIESIRYARQVSNYFNTFEVCRKGNGGSNNQILGFIDEIYNDVKGRNDHYGIQDFDYIVVQLTDIWRDPITFEYENDTHELHLLSNNRYQPKSDDSNKFIVSQFLEYLAKEFGSSLLNFVDFYLKNYVEKIESKFRKYESNGIKRCFIHTWQNEIVPYIKNNQFLNDRFITYDDGKDTFSSIWDLQTKKLGMSINDDEYFKKIGKTPPDGHTSLEAHKIIANSIIKKIENFING
jgi:hypothetical protein